MLYFLKTARNFFIILFLHKVDNISFQISLGSYLAALVWQTGVHRNVATGKEVKLLNLIRSSYDTTIFDVIILKIGSYFFPNTFLHEVDDISFLMSLGSQ